jgi:hypothetical protein
VYADGYWKHIVDDHLRALKDSGITWDLVFGIVGTEENVREVALQLPEETRIVSYSEGFEQHTLNLLHDDVQAGYDGPVLYAHTKGSAHPSRVSSPWRECMTRQCVRRGRHALSLLSRGASTVGAHWLTKADDPKRVEIPFYGGNFWWSSIEHLRRLDRPSDAHRHMAEAWLGSVVPERPVNLVPGWPGSGCETH